jgi:hypothetical protein
MPTHLLRSVSAPLLHLRLPTHVVPDTGAGFNLSYMVHLTARRARVGGITPANRPHRTGTGSVMSLVVPASRWVPGREWG